MKVYNQDKTFELSYYDLEKGYLVSDKLVVMHHEAKGAFDGVGHYKTTTYPNGGVDKEWIWDIPPSNAEDAWDETEDILVYIPYTQRELYEMEIQKLKKNLFDTDYQAIKFSEGMLPEAEYAPMRTQRQYWRDRINDLEKML